jgi:class 3 adenylate cyclase
MMEADEIEPTTALNVCRSISRISIAGHHGRGVDTAGVSVLTVFDSVVEAAECAVETQTRNQATQYRSLPRIDACCTAPEDARRNIRLRLDLHSKILEFTS